MAVNGWSQLERTCRTAGESTCARPASTSTRILNFRMSSQPCLSCDAVRLLVVMRRRFEWVLRIAGPVRGGPTPWGERLPGGEGEDV